MHKKQHYDLIIFDCDGTLADSEIAHNTALMNQLHKLGLIHYDLEAVMTEFMGRADPDIMESVEVNHSVRFPASYKQEKEALYNKLLPHHIRIDDTCRPLLQKLGDVGQKMAVGSNGTRNNVIETIKAAGFKEFFPDDHIFTFEDVARPKPAPDLYLHVCETMKVKPENAIVIEDTITGARAGIAAGIDTIGYVGLTHREGQAQRLKDIGCKSVIESIGELDEILFI